MSRRGLLGPGQDADAKVLVGRGLLVEHLEQGGDDGRSPYRLAVLADAPGSRVRALSGTDSAAAIAYIVSSVGLRVPRSSPDRVALPTPAAPASPDSEIPRVTRNSRSRRPTAGSNRLVPLSDICLSSGIVP